MISSPTSTCRRRQALRAALITLLALTGCQGSLRSWRRDEPTLRDLAAAQHSLDAARDRGREAMHGRDGARSSYAETASGARTRNGRANPYAAQSAAEEERRVAAGDDSADDELADEANYQEQDAKFREYVRQADPAHRAMLEQAYQAMQTFGQSKSKSRISDDMSDSMSDNREAMEGEYDEAQAAAAIHRLTKSKQVARSNSTNTKTKSKPGYEVSPASYSTSDRHQRSDERDHSEVRQASATRSLEGDDLGNRTQSRPTRPSGEPVHYQLKDDSEDLSSDDPDYEPEQSASADRGPLPKSNSSQPATKPATRPQEIAPPSKSGAPKRAVKEPAADTGFDAEIQIVPLKGGARESDSASSRKNSPAARPTAHANAVGSYDDSASGIDSHYTDSSQVVQASTAAASSSNRESNGDSAAGSRRTSGPSATTSSPSTVASSTSSSTSSNANLEDSHALIRRTLRALEQEPVEDNPNAQLNHQVTKRVLCVLLGELDQALEPIPGLQPREQEYFRHNLQALYNSIDPRGNPVLARRWPLVMENHRSAMSQLGAVSNLQVKNVAFCSNVEGFGSVTKFPTNQFKPNQELLLYCEVENFVSEEIKGGYETKLRGNYEIVDANQTRVADFLLPQETDMCSSPRRDYFFVYRIYTPQNIAPGRYQLRLTIEDMKGNKFGQTSLDMQIVAQ